MIAIRCFRRFKTTRNGTPAIEQLTRVLELAAFPQRGMILEFPDGGRTPVMWVSVRVQGGQVEVGTETEPADRYQAARLSSWEPHQPA